MIYRREVDGLRAVAVLPVIFFHAGFAGFSGGYVGVDVFFVISGYLITSIILDDLKQGRFSIVNFYDRRVRRILPALFLVMATCLLAAWIMFPPVEMKGFAQSLFAVPLFVSNFLFWRQNGYFDTAVELKPLLHTWSLAVEEQFYVVFPVFLALAWRYARARIPVLIAMIAGVSLAIAQWTSTHAPVTGFYLLPSRAWELLIGSLVAFFLAREAAPGQRPALAQPLSLLGLALLAASIVAFDANTPFPSLYALAPTVGTALILLFAAPDNVAGKLLGSRILVGIGLVSYSAYLWHQPLFAFARNYHFAPLHYGIYVALSALTFALAYVTWRFVEAPFRDKRRVGRGRIAALAVLFSAAFVLVGLAGHLNDGFNTRDNIARFVPLQWEPKRYEPARCGAEEMERLGVEKLGLSYCATRGLAQSDAVVLGDSHAEDKFYGIASADTSRSWSLIGNASCPPVLSVLVESNVRDCEARFKKVLDWVTGSQAISTVVLSFYGNYPLTTSFAADHIGRDFGLEHIKISSREFPGTSRTGLFAQGLGKTISTLLAANKRVVVVVDVPELPFFPSVCLKGRPGCSVLVSTTMERQRDHRLLLRDIENRFPGVKVFDPTAMFCDATTCGYRSGETVLYRDSHHLTLEGSKLYGQRFKRWLDAL